MQWHRSWFEPSDSMLDSYWHHLLYPFISLFLLHLDLWVKKISYVVGIMSMLFIGVTS